MSGCKFYNTIKLTNEETQKEIIKLVESLNLPKKYMGFYIRVEKYQYLYSLQFRE